MTFWNFLPLVNTVCFAAHFVTALRISDDIFSGSPKSRFRESKSLVTKINSSHFPNAKSLRHEHSSLELIAHLEKKNLIQLL